MDKEREIDKLARYAMITAAAAVILALCWFFRDVIVYMLLAGVVALIGRPVMDLLNRIKIRGKGLPQWFYAILTIVIILVIFLSAVTLLVPIIAGIAKDISMANIESAAHSAVSALKDLNRFLSETFPALGSDFRIEKAILGGVKDFTDVSVFSSIFSSAASFIASFGIGLFAVMFISFFFLKGNNLFPDIIAALVPDRHEANAREAYRDIEHLLSRYFVGLIIEMAGVAIVDFIGLVFVARIGFNAAIGIAFICGVMNIIPYVGPWLGGGIGALLALTMKYICMDGSGLDVSFWVFVLILVGIFWAAQIIDNYIFQPIVYSSSIKANPLEIFIVMLMAGHIGGIIGMLVAIPCYTVLRVIGGRFFGHVKFVRKLMGTQAAASVQDNSSGTGLAPGQDSPHEDRSDSNSNKG